MTHRKNKIPKNNYITNGQAISLDVPLKPTDIIVGKGMRELVKEEWFQVYCNPLTIESLKRALEKD